MNIVMYTPETVTCLNIYTDIRGFRTYTTTKGEVKHLLGTIGNLAPFHSQIQNNAMTRNPENKGASTTADFHGKVTPP